MLGPFGHLHPAATALFFAIVLLVSWGAGLTAGRRYRKDGTQRPAEKFEAAIVAILGLLLGFTFSMSLGKYDRRREMLVADSNSIGDFYTCASLLRDPVRTRLQDVIRTYTALRLQLTRDASAGREVGSSMRRFTELQGQMTALVGEALADGTPIAIPLTNTLNNLTSAHAARLVAVEDRIPESVVLLLFVAGAAATMLIGLDQDASSTLPLGGTMSFLLVISLVVFVVFDLNDPVGGLIRVSQEPMERVLASMGK
jgi:hypothetical protein